MLFYKSFLSTYLLKVLGIIKKSYYICNRKHGLTHFRKCTAAQSYTLL